MAHILIIPDQVRSKLLTTVALADRLQALGHEITWAVPEALTSQLSGHAQVSLDLSLRRPAEMTGDSASARRAAILDAIDIAAFDQVLSSAQPDLLLIDIEAHVAVIAAAGRRLPLALLSVFFNLRADLGLPPLSSSLIPGRSSRFAIRLSWWRLWVTQGLAQLQRYWRRRGTDQYSLLKDWGQRCGYPLQDAVDQRAWLSPFVYRALPILTTNALELEFPLPPAATKRYIGPMVNTDRSNTTLSAVDSTAAAAIKTLLERTASDPSRSLVYCAFGAYYAGDDRGFWQQLARAVADQPWDVIFALGERLSADSLGALPDNVLCVAWAPQTQILAEADVAVVHGGMTSVYECLHYRVPMLLYPYAVNDQYGTAARVAFHGVGLMGNRERDTSAEIRAGINQLLTDHTVAQRIDVMQRSIEQHSHDRRLTEVVDSLLG